MLGYDARMSFFLIFLALLIGHVVADYPLQGEFLARLKNRHDSIAQSMGPGSWLHGLLAHSAIHAGAVWLITGIWWLGLAEMAAHAITDFLKCEKRIGFNTDQLIHVICKFIWAAIAVSIPR